MFGRCEPRPGDDPARSRRRPSRHQPRQSPRCQSSAIDRRAQSADTVDDDLGDSLRRAWATFGDVVTDPLEIVGRIGGPANEHQPPYRW
jgi:hypothetical protein